MANEIKYLGADGTSRLVYYIKQRQPMITSVAKLSADLVEDGTTNKVFTATEQTKLSGIASGAQVNVLESVKVNGSALTISSKAVDVLMKNIDSTNTTAQATSSSEAINGSGTINLHKIAKTGTYSDLIGTPALGTASALDTGTSQGNIPVLGSGGKLPSSVVPASAITDTFVASSQAGMLALSSAEVGDVCVRTDINKTFILKAEPYSTLANWQELLTPTDAVLSVNGQTGAVSLSASDVGAEPAFNKNTAFNQNFETSTNNIKMNGTVSVGSLNNVARADHIHPSDTSKQDVLTAGDNITITNNVISAEPGIKEINTQTIDLMDVEAGIYKLTYAGQITYIYSRSGSIIKSGQIDYYANQTAPILIKGIGTSFAHQSSNNGTFIILCNSIIYGICGNDTNNGCGEFFHSGNFYSILTSYYVKNDLTTTASGNVLDARQGKALKDEIDTLPDTAITTTEIDALFS